MATVKKAQKGAVVKKSAPKSKMMAGEMTGKMYKKSEIDEIGRKQAAELDKSGVFGKAAMAKKNAKKMKNGGSLAGLKASNKRVGPIDPKGAYTKVQEKTLAGAKGKATLTKDKQLGATKMKKGGAVKKCKYGCK